MRLALLAAFALLLAGCQEEDAGTFHPDLVAAAEERDAQDREAVLAALDPLDDDAFRQAFDQLEGYAYTRYVQTEQQEDDQVVAQRERTVRVTGPPDDRTSRVLEVDSAGQFDFGYFRRFVSENVDTTDPPDLAPFVLPEDAAFFAPQSREEFLYYTRPDTLLWRDQARVLEIRARPDSDQNVRRARLYLDRRTDQLIAAEVWRVDLSTLFREESRFFLHLQRGPGGTWLPYNTRFQTRIRTPFRDAQSFRTVSTYSDFERLSGAGA